MEGMEEKLNTILNDPKMMESILSMAKTLSQTSPPTPEDPPRQDNPMPQLDPGMLQKLSGFAQQGSIDRNQQALLKALAPYLSRDRVNKLEKAMRAAKMAKFATVFLNSGGLQLLSGR